MDPQQPDPSFRSFGDVLNVAVFGASGGIGRAFVDRLAGHPKAARIAAFSRSDPGFGDPKVHWAPVDLEDEKTIAGAANTASKAAGPFDLVLVATGLLHEAGGLQPEKSWRALEVDSLEKAFAVNSIGPAIVAKHVLPLLARDRKAVFAALSARVGSIEDNRLGGWHAYRASKAALNMLIRSFSIELARRNPSAICVALHPGTVDTALSRPFQAGVPEGRLFTPAQAAGRLLGVLDRLTPEDSGHLFAWDGERLPF
ncbi:MAG: SDR family NAD(P)-dependent oxidoreductase [Kiloniellales bacterium]|nr:SDR family NAD(P)-dependent oxidoreductase [Kiloniellales bacterium]